MTYQAADERRQQFVEAAIRVIAREGVAGATTRKIAAEAQATLALLHYCFQTKQDLLHEVFTQCTERGLERAQQGIQAGMGLPAAITTVFRNYERWTLDDPATALSQYELVVWGLRRSDAADLPRTAYQRYVLGTARLLLIGASDLDLATAEALATHLVALVDGHTLQWLSTGTPSFSDRIDGAVALLLESCPTGATQS